VILNIRVKLPMALQAPRMHRRDRIEKLHGIAFHIADNSRHDLKRERDTDGSGTDMRRDISPYHVSSLLGRWGSS